MKFKVKKIRKNKKHVEHVESVKAIGAKKRQLFQIGKNIAIFIGTLALTTVVYFNDQAGEWFRASVLNPPQPFNGTVVPVAKVPNWTHWGGNNYTTHYSEIADEDFIDLPEYNPGLLQFPDENLEWGNDRHDEIRNAKITYPVMYMGNYELDHKENAGSHIAIDIKIPVGTPLHTIANGQVVKTKVQNTGFGNHVVVKHINVPDPDNPGSLTTLYSSYSHMDEIHVTEGQNILKGQIIGTSGNTGTSTTPHLHFQVDTDDAPWYPYWPFSWSEAQAAGLSFFEAVNSGLGAEKGMELTINPMTFVYNQFDSTAVTSGGSSVPAAPVETETINEPAPEPEVANDPGVEIVENPIAEEAPESISGIDPNLFDFNITGESVGLIGSSVTLIAQGNVSEINQMSDSDEIRVTVDGSGSAVKTKYDKGDLPSGTARINIKSDTAGKNFVSFGRGQFTVEFVEKLSTVAKFEFEHDGKYIQNVEETVKLKGVDQNGNFTPAISFSGTVDLSTQEGQAVITPAMLRVSDFKNGVAEIKVKPIGTDRVVLKAQQGALVGYSDSMTIEDRNVFADVNLGHNNYEAIKYLKEQGIINGYSDGTYKPGNVVNRVEALKMLMLAFNVEAVAGTPLPFYDTANDAWYASTLAAALNKSIVAGYPDGSFKPANTVNRAELLKILFNTADVDFSDALVVDPYDDVPVGAWFAKYAYLAKKQNIVDGNSHLRPSDGMTRADVAEAIYRMKMIQENNLVSYTK